MNKTCKQITLAQPSQNYSFSGHQNISALLDHQEILVITVKSKLAVHVRYFSSGNNSVRPVG